MSPDSGRTLATRSVTRLGVVVPMVSAIASRSAPLSRAAVTMSSTRCGGVGPSNGQSHAVAMMTSTVAPLSWAIATMSAICATASAVDLPTLARLWPSAADTTYSMERRPAAIARLAPFGLATSAENSTPCEVGQLGGQFGGIGKRGHLRSARRTRWPRSPGRRWRRSPRACSAWRTTGSDPRSAARRASRPRGCRRVREVRSYDARLLQRGQSRRRSCRAGRGTPRRCAGPAAPNRRCGWCPGISESTGTTPGPLTLRSMRSSQWSAIIPRDCSWGSIDHLGDGVDRSADHPGLATGWR